MDYWGTKEVSDKLKRHFRVASMEEVYTKLHIDAPHGIEPEYTGPKLTDDTDVFGCRYKRVNYGAGTYNECVYHPLAQYDTLDDLTKGYKWPTPDFWNYSNIKKDAEKGRGRPIKIYGSEPFLYYKNMRGEEQAFVDLSLNPDIVHFCLDKLFELRYIENQRVYEAIPGKVDITYVAEDMGSQTSLLFSPAHIREFFLPRMKRMIDLAHQAGAKVMHHNDGAVRAILPDLIGIGIDVLNPVQWRCPGMEREGLKKDFGDKLVFHGAVDNQYTLPFGKPGEVRKEVVDNLKILGKGGGYILGPCHNIQPVSPIENILALYQTGYEEGWR